MEPPSSAVVPHYQLHWFRWSYPLSWSFILHPCKFWVIRQQKSSESVLELKFLAFNIFYYYYYYHSHYHHCYYYCYYYYYYFTIQIFFPKTSGQVLNARAFGTLTDTPFPESCLAVFTKTVRQKLCKLCLTVYLWKSWII